MTKFRKASTKRGLEPSPVHRNRLCILLRERLNIDWLAGGWEWVAGADEWGKYAAAVLACVFISILLYSKIIIIIIMEWIDTPHTPPPGPAAEFSPGSGMPPAQLAAPLTPAGAE